MVLSLHFIDISYEYKSMEGNSEAVASKEDNGAANTENPAGIEEKFQNLIMKKMSDIQLQISGIHKDLERSIAPQFLDVSIQTNDLIELAIELWRMERKINKLLSALPEDQRETLDNSLQKLKRYLSKNDIEVMDHTNQKYDDGQNLEILAVEKDPGVLEPVIKETIEPTILYKGQVVHIGKVIIVNKEEG